MSDSGESHPKGTSSGWASESGRTLRAIVDHLRDHPTLLVGLAAMLLSVVAIGLTANANPEARLFPYALLVFGFVLVAMHHLLAPKRLPGGSQGTLSQLPVDRSPGPDDTVKEPAVPRPSNLSFEAFEPLGWPVGWFNSVGYVDGVSDRYEARVLERPEAGSGACVHFGYPGASGEQFGSLMQRVPARRLAGKAIRLEAELRCRRVEQWAGIWLRGDGADIPNLVFDNMSRRALRGDTRWRRCVIEVTLPSSIAWLNYGVVLCGPGEVWADNFRLLVWENDEWVAV